MPVMARLGQRRVAGLVAGIVLLAVSSATSPFHAEARAVTGPSSIDINDLGCSGASFCIAVGTASSGTSLSNVIEKWDGKKWSAVVAPDRPRSRNELLGVNCPSTTFCMATGFAIYGKIHREVPESVTWNGTHWILSTWYQSLGRGYMGPVSCGGTSFCMTIDSYGTYGSGNGYSAAWNGTDWTNEPTNCRPSNGDCFLEGITCLKTFCMAVGSVDAGQPPDQTLVEDWNGTAWSVVPSANTSPSESNDLYGVKCLSSTSCFAVGGIELPSGPWEPLMENWNGTSWTVQTLTGPGTDDYLSSVSCSSQSNCIAVGPFSEATRWNGAAWTEMSAPAGLNAVRCVSTTFCLAVGGATSAYWNGTSWTAVPISSGSPRAS
jgi:hypothetical protein